MFSCEKKVDKVTIEEDTKVKIPIVVEFGFTLNDYLVVQDTIKNGDTFGKLLENHNIGNFKVHEVTEQVKDSFNMRDIRVGRPITLLKSKETKSWNENKNK